MNFAGVKQVSRSFATSARVCQDFPVLEPLWGNGSKNSALNSLIRGELEKPKEEKIVISPRFGKKFVPEETYDPFDFSFARKQLEFQKRSRTAKFNTKFHTPTLFGESDKQTSDPFRRVNINPLSLYTFSSILRYYISETGRIFHRDANVGMSARNQKKLAKAIKRARAVGTLSNTSKIGMDAPTSSYQPFSSTSSATPRKPVDFTSTFF